MDEAQTTFGGMKRDEVPAEDFAGKARSFPIVTTADVSDAAASIGRAGPDNYSTDELKANIVKIAKRKGAEFVKALPQKWQDELKASDPGEIPNLEEAATIKAQARAAIRALKAMLADKTLPKSIQDAIDHVGSEFTKTWGDLADSASTDTASATSESYDEWYGALPEGTQQLIEDHIHGLKSALDKERHRNRQASEALQGEAIDSDTVPLLEKAVRSDGTIPIKIIQAGWGASGYYPKEVLMRDGSKVFAPGLKMYWNHPTKTQEAEQPERSLRDLAGVLVSGARWDENGKAGAGLYADAKIFGDYAKSLNELAPHIGVSIRAMGKVKAGEAEGRKGTVIEAIAGAQSVDFVTAPGAGGKVLELFEAARDGSHEQPKTTEVSTMDEKSTAQLSEMEKQLTESKSEIDKLKEKLILREASEAITTELAKSKDLPEITKARLMRETVKNVPVTEKGELDRDKLNTLITEAVKVENTYLAEVLKTGSVRGMGDASTTDDKTSIVESFVTLYAAQGISPDKAKVMAEISAGGK
jgi:hypothetical protein